MIITLLIEEREQLRKLGCKMKSFQQFQEEGSHGETVGGEFILV